MNACPYVEKTFDILGKKWSAMIIHYVYSCENHTTNFTDIKHHLHDITPRALSIRLSELVDDDIIKKDENEARPQYGLTERGINLAVAMEPLQKWGKKYLATN